MSAYWAPLLQKGTPTVRQTHTEHEARSLVYSSWTPKTCHVTVNGEEDDDLCCLFGNSLQYIFSFFDNTYVIIKLT